MKKWQLILGSILLLFGLFALIEVIFDIDLGGFIWPLILIGIGSLMLLRPRMVGEGVQVNMPIFADIHKKGAWQVGRHEIWTFVGSVRLDFTDAIFDQNEGEIKIYGFVPEVKITLPDDVGLRVESAGFVTEIRTPTGKTERFLSSQVYETENFLSASKRIVLQTGGFVSEVRLKSSLL